MTLDQFRKHFLNISVLVAVLITAAIGWIFVGEMRESSGIVFGKLSRTDMKGEPFNKQASFVFEEGSLLKTAKVALNNPKVGSIKEAKILADKLQIGGKESLSKDALGKQYVKIQARGASLSYRPADGSWSYFSFKKTKGVKPVSTGNKAEEVARSFLKRLNFEKGIEIYKVTPLTGTSTHMNPTEDESKASQFLVSFVQRLFGAEVFSDSYQPKVTVTVDRLGTVVKASYKKIQIDEANIGEYPIIGIVSVKKRLEAGLGRIVYSDSELLSDRLGKVFVVSFTNIKLVYLADEKNNLLRPFWALDGETTVSDNKVKLTVIVDAVVDKYLKDE